MLNVSIPCKYKILPTASNTEKGILYFANHKSLWGYLFAVFVPELVLTLLITICFFVVGAPFWWAFAIFGHGMFTTFSLIGTILYTSSILSQWICVRTVLRIPLKKAFDKVLRLEGTYNNVVFNSQIQRKSSKGFLSFMYSGFMCLVFLAIAIIPFAGRYMIILLKTKERARRCHYRYFELKGLRDNQIENSINSQWGEYLVFGLVSGYLESFPLVGSFFILTNIIGSALWASKMEEACRLSFVEKEASVERKVCRRIKSKRSLVDLKPKRSFVDLKAKRSFVDLKKKRV